jgi:hypothetical protein
MFRAGSIDSAILIDSYQDTVSYTYITLSLWKDTSNTLPTTPQTPACRLLFLLIVMSADVAMHSDDYHNDGREQHPLMNGHAVPKDQDYDMSDDDVPLVGNSSYFFPRTHLSH